MRAKRVIAIAVAAIGLSWLVAVSLSLRDSAAELTALGARSASSGTSRPEALPAARDHAPVQAVEQGGADTENSSALRGDVAKVLDDAMSCYREQDFACASVALSRLNDIRELDSLERAQSLYVAALLEAAQGRRNAAIRIFRDEIPELADLPNDVRARMQGILAGIYFNDGRYGDALDAVDMALALAPNDSLVQMRDRIITARSRSTADSLGEIPIEPNDRILLNEVIE